MCVCVFVCLKSSRITCLIGPPSAALWLLYMSSTTQLERARLTVDKFYERAKQLGQMYRIYHCIVFKTDETTSLNFRSHLFAMKDWQGFCESLGTACAWAMSKHEQTLAYLRYECLRSSGAQGQHIANQWFDLSKSNVWRVKQRSFGSLSANRPLSADNMMEYYWQTDT